MLAWGGGYCVQIEGQGLRAVLQRSVDEGWKMCGGGGGVYCPQIEWQEMRSILRGSVDKD